MNPLETYLAELRDIRSTGVNFYRSAATGLGNYQNVKGNAFAWSNEKTQIVDLRKEL